MRKGLFTAAVLAGMLFLTGCTSPRDIAGELRAAVQAGQYFYGHQDDLMYGHSWNASAEKDSSSLRSDVFSVCGSYPAVLGLDLGGIELGKGRNLDRNNFAIMRKAIRDHHERGGIVTLSWHLRNPLTAGDSWDVSSDKVVESILEGGAKHELFEHWLDNVADYILSLKDSHGKQIPVIFRPWHEHSGSWFWWGRDLCTAEQYNALWKETYDYLVTKRGIKGLLWAISPNSVGGRFEEWEERYPGDEYVDIIGLDCYSTSRAKDEFVADVRRSLASLQAFSEAHGKILAFTETGDEGLPHEDWWSGWLMEAGEGFPVAYVLTWRNASDRPEHFFAPFPGSPSEKDFKENFIASGKVLMLNNID